VEGALNADANLPLFIQQFQPSFPVGMANQLDALNFMQISPMVRTFVPYIAFIDRKGIIRAQFTGGDVTDETLEKILRENAEKLVNERSRPAKAKGKP
jgi:hypothetical protein